MFFVKAAEGLRIIDPTRRDRLPEGKFRPVPEDSYWLRMAATGDVMLLREPPADDQIEGHVPTPPDRPVQQVRAALSPASSPSQAQAAKSGEPQ